MIKFKLLFCLLLLIVLFGCTTNKYTVIIRAKKTKKYDISVLKNFRELMCNINEYKAAQDYDRIIEVTTRVLKDFPEQAPIFALRSFAYKQKKLYNEALSDIYSAIYLCDYYADYYTERAEIFEKLGQHDLAIIDYNHVIKKFSGNQYAVLKRANYFERKNEYNLAINDLSILIEKNYQPLTTCYTRANLYYKLGSFDLAAKDYDACIKADPKCYNAILYKSICLYKLELYDDALDKLNYLISKNQNVGESYFYIGNINSETEKYKEAVNSFDLAYQKNPLLYQALYNKAQAQDQLAEFDGALISYRDYLKFCEKKNTVFSNHANKRIEEIITRFDN